MAEVQKSIQSAPNRRFRRGGRALVASAALTLAGTACGVVSGPSAHNLSSVSKAASAKPELTPARKLAALHGRIIVDVWGDSITAGTNTTGNNTQTHRELAFPALLQTDLNRGRSPADHITVNNYGAPGSPIESMEGLFHAMPLVCADPDQCHNSVISTSYPADQVPDLTIINPSINEMAVPDGNFWTAIDGVTKAYKELVMRGARPGTILLAHMLPMAAENALNAKTFPEVQKFNAWVDKQSRDTHSPTWMPTLPTANQRFLTTDPSQPDDIINGFGLLDSKASFDSLHLTSYAQEMLEVIYEPGIIDALYKTRQP